MKKKIIRLLIVVLIVGLYCTGCNPMRLEDTTVDIFSEKLVEWKSLSPKDVEKHIQVEVSDTYRIDADIRISEELDDYEIPNVYLQRHVYDDTQVVLEQWLKYCDISSYSEVVVGESDDLLEGKEKISYAMADFGEENQSFAQVRSVYAMMSTPFLNNFGSWNVNGMFDIQKQGWVAYEDMKLPAEKEILSQEKVSDIKQNAEAIFDVEFLDEYELYTYTLERLKEVLDVEDAYAKDMGFPSTIVWDAITEDAEFAVLLFQQGYKDIPLFYGDVSKNTTGALWKVGNYFSIALSKEKVEFMECMNPYDIVGEAESVKILSFGDFIEKHIQMCSGIDTTVVCVDLYYLPIYTGEDLDFVTKPIWCVQTEETDAYGYASRQTSIYDAVTGEEIIW